MEKKQILSRQDVVELAVKYLSPLMSRLTNGCTRVLFRGAGAYYDEAIAGMEGFSRALWAIVPMLKGKVPEAEPLWQKWKQGIINGTDPTHSEYWGDTGDSDQRFVEMAVMGMALLMIPDRFYDELPANAQKNLTAWLYQINEHEIPRNNWVFFRVMVNIGLMHVHAAYDEKRLQEDLDEIERHYGSGGWYYDKTDQRDYYTLWAFQYYAPLYALYMQDRDPDRCEKYMTRARQLLPRYACWQDGTGRFLPYGRSLTYRFAQSAFPAMCAYAGITAADIGMGELKHMILGNLRYWDQMPILDNGDMLTVGYGYPNLGMAEGYNAPGSPYWGMKAFLILALPEEHPFWQAEEKAFIPPRVFCDLQARQVLTRDEQNTQVIAYSAGNHAFEHNQEDAKYEKFAVSTHFGFSISKDRYSLSRCACDSSLALSDENGAWYARNGQTAFSLSENEIRSVWQPMQGVTVETLILPRGEWHIRKHTITSSRVLTAAEGGFACPKDTPGKRLCERIPANIVENGSAAWASSPLGTSGIFAIQGYKKAEMLRAEPNTSLIWPRTLIPTLYADIQPGQTVLICCVLGSTAGWQAAFVPEDILTAAGQL